MISKENEIAAWDLITRAVNLAIKKYDTTLDEDLEIIQKDNKD